MYYLVLLETSGNQHYIFATNKLRENVGASELTARVGLSRSLEAVALVTRIPLYANDLWTLHANLLSKEKNPPLESGRLDAEVILATSGKALLLVRHEALGQEIVRYVTEQTLRLTPGLTVHGAISPVPETLTLQEVHQAIGKVHTTLGQVRYAVPGMMQRLARRPFVAECATSGLPAAQYDTRQPEPGARSVVALAKRQAAQVGQRRMAAVVQSMAPQVRLPRSIDDLETRFAGLEWLAVIHADGNGLGQLLLQFHQWMEQMQPGAQGRDYLNAYRRFSLALDVCTARAFGAALTQLQQRTPREESTVPVLPLVLGGDDLTVVCDGQMAVRFTHDFLTAFEVETSQRDPQHLDGIIPAIAHQQASGAPRLSSCAGIAIVKPHFPFHAAYELSEALLQSAKQVKTKLPSVPCSALDYHVLYDASGADLERIRAQLMVDSGATVLVGRPYVVTPPADLGEAQRDTWVAPRLWEHLQRRVKAMQATDAESGEEARRRLPNSMLHSLREGLFLGHQPAEARVQLVRQRYDLAAVLESTGSLFWPEHGGHMTGFLDALDLVGFWD